MAFTPHPSFAPPANPCARIWRYTDMAKLLSLLDRSALYFPRLDKLEDPFEGYYTKNSPVVCVENLSLEELKHSLKAEDENLVKIAVSNGRLMRQFNKLQREITFVSSWHCQEHESAAMWSQYLKTQEGIAIRSSYDRLCSAFSNYDDYEIFIGTVSYLDYNRDSIGQGNSLAPVLSKRKSFEHEREVRAVIWN